MDSGYIWLKYEYSLVFSHYKMAYENEKFKKYVRLH